METVSERLNRAHDLIEEAVSVLEDVGAELGQPLGPTTLNLAVTHARLALRRIEDRMHKEIHGARVL